MIRTWFAGAPSASQSGDFGDILRFYCAKTEHAVEPLRQGSGTLVLLSSIEWSKHIPHSISHMVKARVSVRQCSASELSEISILNNPGSEATRAFFARQEREEIYFLVAWSGGVPVGSVEVVRDATGEIRNLHVLPHAQNKGVGTKLIEESEARLRADGFQHASVGVASDNSDARRLYVRLGYVPTGIFETYAYTFINDSGESSEVTETSELLVKDISLP